MEQKEGMIYIPYGIKSRREFFEGFGLKEFKITLGSLFFSTLISLALKMIFKQEILSSMFFLLIPIATIILTVKDKCNLSVIGYIAIMIKFSSARKFYPYKGEKWVA